MRWLLILVLTSGAAWSQPLSPTPAEVGKPPTERPTRGQHQAQPVQRITIESPVEVKPLNTPKTAEEAKKDAEEREEQASDRRRMVQITGAIAFLAFLQLCALIAHAYFFNKQARALRDTIEVNRTAANAAFVSSMPVLSPRLTGGTQLHPLQVQVGDFDSRIHLVFENLGKTPAIIRSLRVDLILNREGDFTHPSAYSLTPIEYNPVVGPETDGSGMGVADYRKRLNLSHTEYRELLAEAVGPHRRFDLVGEVVYDDFFGYRHTRWFCVRLRFFIQDGQPGLFQLVRGSEPYNSITRHKIETT